MVLKNTKKIFFFLILLQASLLAGLVDTTISGNGGPGPYYIGNGIIDSASLTIKLLDSMSVPPWTFIPDNSAVLFSLPIDSGVPIRFRFFTSFYGVPKRYSLYTRKRLDLADTSLQATTAAPSLQLPPAERNLTVSGYKSMGVSLGSFGAVNLEQGLDVRIGGQIKPQTSVNAHLADKGSSLDGQTREISDFDLIYLALEDPDYRAVAGDQYVRWPFAGLLSGEKKIKGLSAAWSPRSGPFSFGAFGALAGGKVTVETKQGRTGVQGPYYLTGGGESDFIQPVSGTVRVRLNGRQLDEGNDRDFIVDYEIGSVTFTPKIPVKDEDLIRIEYEYKLFNYQRTLLGTTAGAAAPDSVIFSQGVFWSESDNKNSPVDRVLSADEVDALKRAGDRLPYSTTARPVHPNDVAGESQFYPLYRRQAVGADSAFVYTPFDRTHPDSVLGFFYVWFRPVNSKSGEKGSYRPLFSDSRGTVYCWAGRDSGTHTDLAPIPAPEARRSGELRTGVRLRDFTATLDVAGQDHDKNLFSDRNDNDNQASATAFSFFAGVKEPDRPSLWVSGSHRFVSSRFDAEAVSANDRKRFWDDTRLTEPLGERQQWDATAGATLLPGLQATLCYGQNRTGPLLATDKIAPGMQYATAGERLSLEYGGSFFRHFEPAGPGRGRRENGAVRLKLLRSRFGLLYRDEWRTDSPGNGSGLYEGGFSWDFSPFGLHEQATYVSRRKSPAGTHGSADTGHSVRWEQSLDRALLPSWHVSGSSSYDRSIDNLRGKTSTVLVDVTSAVDPRRSGFSSRQHYRASSEMATAFVQVPVFAGKGMGTYVYDSVRGEYVPHVPGDYFIQQQEVYDQSSGLRVRTTSAEVTWSYSPKRQLAGILNDLSWLGTLSSQEQTDARRTGLSLWAPGYHSLVSYFSGTYGDDPARYADISYRQEIDWARRSDSSRGATGRFSITPGYRKIRSYREGSLESRLEFDRPVKSWTVGAAVNLFSLHHEDTLGPDYSMLDRRLELSQKCQVSRTVSFSLLEAGGLLGKNNAISSVARQPFDSMFYYQLAPSLAWQPLRQGMVTAQYTYSVVPFSGDVDYRMARGFSSGVSHQALVTADVKMGERLLILGTYRGDLRRQPGDGSFGPANHFFSLEVRVFL